MEKINVILEKISTLLEAKRFGVLKRDVKVRVGPKSGIPRGTSKTFIVPKGTPVRVSIIGRTYEVYVLDGKFKGMEISRSVDTDEIDYSKEKRVHKKYMPEYPL